MVGTAIWWTKEEAERDAAATGLPIVGLGPMSGTVPIEQHHGDPLPITNDMHRLMEACRIGEFKDEGGSETVEALAVASLDAKSCMGHDVDSYMAGYSAALYEQAEPFIWLSLNSQHQGEPVALPARKQWNGLLATADNLRGEGWNGCLDEIAKLGPLYTHPVPANPGEVERLRTELQKEVFRRQSDESAYSTVVKQNDTLRDQLAEARRILETLTSGRGMSRLDIDQFLSALSASAEPSALPDPLGCNECAHADCGKYNGPRQVECRAMADNACARPGASS